MDVRLRPATSEDAEQVATVYVESWNVGFAGLTHSRRLTSDEIARWERDLDNGPVSWWLAEHGATVVGFVGTGPSRDPIDPSLGELDTIAVAPDAWRQGVGYQLMCRALQSLAEAGYHEAILWTFSGYERGRTFYKMTGWHITSRTRDRGRQVAFRRALYLGNDG